MTKQKKKSQKTMEAGNDASTVVSVLCTREGINGRELSMLTGLGSNTVYCAMRGEPILLSTAVKLADYFGVSLNSLLLNDVAAAEAEYSYTKTFGRSGLCAAELIQAPAPGEVTGLELNRRRRHMSEAAIAALAGVGTSRVVRLENHGGSLGSYGETLVRIANVMDLSVDELFRKHSAEELTKGDRSHAEATSKNRKNCIDNYRVQYNLTFRELGRRLGTSHECARKVCCTDVAKEKYAARLAFAEKLSLEAFQKRYGEKAKRGIGRKEA